MRPAPANLTAAAVERVKDLVQFCQTFGQRCYGNWSPETLEDYLWFHLDQQTISWTQWQGKVCGCGVAWQCQEKEILKAAAEKRLLFDWQATDPTGDCIFLADFACNRRGALEAILRHLTYRFAGWERLKWYTYRRGKLVQLRPGLAAKFNLNRGN